MDAVSQTAGIGHCLFPLAALMLQLLLLLLLLLLP